MTEILLGLQNALEAKRIAQLLEAFTDVPGPTRSDQIEAAALCLRDGQALLAKDRDFDRIAEQTELRLVAVK